MILLLLGRGLIADGASPSPVVINEIHYHPPSPGGKFDEFVEIHNTLGERVNLTGWRLLGGARFEFPADASIPAGGYVVVARRRDSLLERFRGLDPARVFGDFEGSLDNSGDELVLADDFGAPIDSVRYDDNPPWSDAADGAGPSLQRLCPQTPSRFWENWTAKPTDSPTPLRANVGKACPPPQSSVPTIVFTEIHYHPGEDRDELEEFVELHNPGATTISVAGWKLDDGVRYTFPPDDPDAVVEPGEYLVVCRNKEYLRRFFPDVKLFGDFEGDLANGDERVQLVDHVGRLVDVVRYVDSGDWPHVADGTGSSLEKILPTARSDDPPSWTSSVYPTGDAAFLHIEAVGPLYNGSSQRLMLSIDGPGEYVIDNVRLALANGPTDGDSLAPHDLVAPPNSPADLPPANIVVNGDFESDDLEKWRFFGVASGTEIVDGIGVDGSRGLRLISTGECDGECQSNNSAYFFFNTGDLDRTADYRLSMDFRFVRGSVQLDARVRLGVALNPRLGLITPGRSGSRAGSSHVTELPPFFSRRGRFPEEPTSEDPVWLSVRVLNPSNIPLTNVAVEYSRGEQQESVAMLDDGLHGDGFADDGIFGAELPFFEHDDIVLYRFVAAAGDVTRAVSPRPAVPGAPAPEETWGFYVNDLLPDSQIPVYHVLIPGVDAAVPQAINGALNCDVLREGHFAYRGELYPRIGIRFRGNTACVIKKRNLKLRFHRGRFFRDVRKINLQGLWTDKSLLREHLAWEFFRSIGAPYSETEFVRVHLNGKYHGLHLYLEHPDRRFLERNGLDPEGLLYKAKQPPRTSQTPIGVARQPSVRHYETTWELETRDTVGFEPVAGFIDRLHDEGAQPGGATPEFMSSKVIEEQLVRYQIGQIALNSIDSFAKNHFLYNDTRDGRWGFIPWDTDLTFGKFFDPDTVGPGREVGTLNDCMMSPTIELPPWFTTEIRGNQLLNHFVNFFLRAGGDHYQRAYLVRLWDVLMEKYSNETFDPRLDQLEAFLYDEHADDLERWGRTPSNPGCQVPDEMGHHVQVVIKQQIRLHRQFLMNYISRAHNAILDHDRMKITEVMYNPSGTTEQLEYLEILNSSGRAIDISRWSLRGAVDYVFPVETVVESDEVIIVARSQGAFEAHYPLVANRVQVFGDFAGKLANEGEEIRLLDAGAGFPATIDYLRFGEGPPWPEVRDGFSIELADPDPNRDNDDGANWIVSRLEGGTPGSVGGPFVRGDSDRSELVEVGDVFHILHYLFLRGERPDCIDAADADDDGKLAVTDAIFLLRFLFLNGAAPRAPYPDPGLDLSPDGLGC